ncbi:hypothetical protein T12_3328 [Trichinella patagoniensis]|uniref:Uncharacterized protein n=1 Tax=Trichinella patagoniensis TaxID=990121 RepID=A0A0V0ZI31_9BILA|nr:hypothetical protein T12_3328 [Trichinella patagoniensis]
MELGKIILRLMIYYELLWCVTKVQVKETITRQRRIDLIVEYSNRQTYMVDFRNKAVLGLLRSKFYSAYCSISNLFSATI